MNTSPCSRSLLKYGISFLILHFLNLKCISKINLKFVYFMQKNINKQIFIQHFILQKRFWLIHIQIKHFFQCQRKILQKQNKSNGSNHFAFSGTISWEFFYVREWIHKRSYKQKFRLKFNRKATERLISAGL